VARRLLAQIYPPAHGLEVVFPRDVPTRRAARQLRPQIPREEQGEHLDELQRRLVQSRRVRGEGRFLPRDLHQPEQVGQDAARPLAVRQRFGVQ
jgi:hypothetical protein